MGPVPPRLRLVRLDGSARDAARRLRRGAALRRPPLGAYAGAARPAPSRLPPGRRRSGRTAARRASRRDRRPGPDRAPACPAGAAAGHRLPRRPDCARHRGGGCRRGQRRRGADPAGRGRAQRRAGHPRGPDLRCGTARGTVQRVRRRAHRPGRVAEPAQPADRRDADRAVGARRCDVSSGHELRRRSRLAGVRVRSGQRTTHADGGRFVLGRHRRHRPGGPVRAARAEGPCADADRTRVRLRGDGARLGRRRRRAVGARPGVRAGGRPSDRSRRRHLPAVGAAPRRGRRRRLGRRLATSGARRRAGSVRACRPAPPRCTTGRRSRSAPTGR